jgi:two-component system sensor histidine kinase KdpD
MERAQVEAEAERSRSTLLSGVSHDLRTPLSAINAASALLSQDGELMAPAERRELTDLITDESSRLNHLVENILEITRLDRNESEVSREWQPLEGVVGSTLTHLEMQRGPVPVLVKLPANLPLVNIDGALVEQLFVNLLENALKYAPGSEVLLSADLRDDEVMVEVRDGGPGVPETLREHIFDKFYRSPGSQKDGGIGLGLAICRAIVRAHEGRIWVEEAPGGGAAFRFTLPVARGPQIFADGLPS